MPARVVTVLVAAFLAVLAAGPAAEAGFRVTDERAGVTFDAFEHIELPYVCGGPCALRFVAVPGCSGNASFLWFVRDAGEAVVATHVGAGPWRHEFPVGRYSVLESESTGSCGTGGQLLLDVVDRTPPDTTISGSTRRVFTFAASEAGSTFECRFDDLAFEPCSGAVAAPPLRDGEHTFSVRATDSAGNADPTPAATTFSVRRPAPIEAMLRHASTTSRAVTTLTRLEIPGVPSGGTATVTCRGRGCPFASRRLTATASGGVGLSAAFRRARLRPRASVTVLVEAPCALPVTLRLHIRTFPWPPRVVATRPGAPSPEPC
jgi:hypothetical protein